MPDWQEILRRDGPAVWRTGYRLLGNQADADECFQETFLSALEVSRREPIQQWRGLLVRLAAARAVDRLRDRRRNSHVQNTDLSAFIGSEPQPHQVVEDTELSERLRTALALIPRKHAQVFCLHCLEGWSYLEIAQHMEVSLSAVGVFLHRGRKRLRELMNAGQEISHRLGHGPGVDVEPTSLRKELP